MNLDGLTEKSVAERMKVMAEQLETYKTKVLNNSAKYFMDRAIEDLFEAINDLEEGEL